MLKVCGITNVEDALLAVEVGASYIGMIIDAESPRLIDTSVAKDIASVLPKHVKAVGVVDSRKKLDLEKILDSGVSVVQLHWATPSAYYEAKNTLEPYSINVAVAVTGLNLWPKVNVEYFLVDVKELEGKLISWAFRDKGIVGVAGKITPENVREVVELTKPDLVDVSSGVEAKPGKKDPEKLKALAEALGL